MKKITIPELSLVVLVGPSGSGKSSFARKHFKPTEVLSSDYCRGLVSDDENAQEATKDAFEVLRFITRKRLGAGRLTVVDATNVQREARKPLVDLARELHCLPAAIVLNMPVKLCHERNQARPDRQFGQHVVRQQAQHLKRSLRGLQREGFRHVTVLNAPEEMEEVQIERTKLWNDKRDEHGPFDLIGDVHGCYTELRELVERLGYRVSDDDVPTVSHPTGRTLVFLGDLVDRGPDSPGCLRLAMGAVRSGTALCIPGNHETKLLRKLRGRDVRLTHGLAETLEQLEPLSEEFKADVIHFIDGLVSHYVLDDGNLVVAHAGLKADLQGRASARVREFALYGETTGETDAFGLPVRYNWAADYRGKAIVVYGHTPVPEADWLNRTMCIDTGCVYGGKLSALRYPEKELVQVEAKKIYYAPTKPFLSDDVEAPPVAEPRAQHDLLDIKDVSGKRIVNTRVHQTVTIREENAVAALEVMSRFAVDPRWLIYLPPTMSPSDTRKDGDALEHPAESFAYYRSQGVPKVICEEKHMGSRAVVVVCRDESVAAARFGIANEGAGMIYTRTGRPFFDGQLGQSLLARLRTAMHSVGFWETFETDWACIDAELMPWSAKAQELLQSQYAAVGSSSRAALAQAVEALSRAVERTGDGTQLLRHLQERKTAAEQYVEAYRRYCWTVESLADLKLAPFHLLATEQVVHTDKNHVWHMETLTEICRADAEVLVATPFKVVDVTDTASQAEGIAWWDELTDKGGEGMVVKPLDWITRGRRGLVQPAIKCRGREYLRIIYGPEYTLPAHLDRLRSRGLGVKRSLALREFALGLEALHRFVEQEPLYRVHECVFGVLALESEPVDPRL